MDVYNLFYAETTASIAMKLYAENICIKTSVLAYMLLIIFPWTQVERRQKR